ncbi:MAG TPA: heme ABC transporter ATP-binding protein [Solimonas sp.]
MSLVATELHYRTGDRDLLCSAHIHLQPGQVHALLGPNGAGKSTLLRVLSRELRPQRGSIALDGRALDRWPGEALAQVRAVMSQRDQLLFAFTAGEVVTMGRLPHPGGSAAHHADIVEAALSLCGAAHLRDRHYPTLSGGERARVQLARALAQIWEPIDGATRCLLLDEPTASQDLAHQHLCLNVARAFAARGVAVLVVLHDPNLVLMHADKVTVMCCGEVLACGPADEVLTPALLRRTYGIDVRLLRDAETGRHWLQVDGTPHHDP